MEFRFTLFNSVTLLVMAFTLLTAVGFARRTLNRNWPFLYYLFVLVYWKAFDGALNTGWVLLGAVCGVLLRFRLPGERAARILWWLELAALVYIFLRGADLLLGGELFYRLFPFTGRL